jgi:nucleotide-binding universal stress UspA family protein
MSHRVIVGLDGSHESLAAADWAAAEAQLLSAPLSLVQVRETGAYPYSPIADDEIEIRWAERITRETEAELTVRYPGLRTVREELAGRPATVLTHLATESDLLVLGSRGLGSFLGFLVGSVALPTAAHARCPVVLVRAHAETESAQAAAGSATAARPRGDIVLGLDLGQPCQELLDFAFTAAARHDTRLRVVHGWHVPPAAHGHHGPGHEEHERVGRDKDRLLRETLQPWEGKFPAVEVDAQTVVKRPARHLVEAAADASMVVVGRRLHRSPVGTHLGTVTHAVLHHSRAPVVVVPHA